MGRIILPYDKEPSCNVPVTTAEIEMLRDGASENHNPHDHGSTSVRAYWDLRMIALIDALHHKLDIATKALKKIEDLPGYRQDETFGIASIALDHIAGEAP